LNDFSHTGQSVPEKGDTAPYFAYDTYSGERLSLSDLSGKPAVLAFWFPGCGACRSELPQLEEIYWKYSDKGLRVVAIDVTGDISGGKKFRQDKDLFLYVSQC
jgi:thiol-disulfide isomerase/thioredoxin